MRKEYDFSRGQRGAVLPSPGKTRITIMLDDEVIESFRAKAEAQGMGYQTLINATLRAAITGPGRPASKEQPLTADVLRQVLREELAPYNVNAPSTDQLPARDTTKATAPGKYAPLELHLRAVSSTTREVTLSFAEIEQILGAPLPASARTHRPWWANQHDTSNRPQARAWLSAGFRVDEVSHDSRNPKVRFRRSS